MILVGIDIGKNCHFFCVLNRDDGEVLVELTSFKNNQKGFTLLLQTLAPYDKASVLIGTKDTGHYHFALLRYLLNKEFNVALINPIATDMTRKMQGGISKNDKLDTLTICDVMSSSNRKKSYRITKIDKFDHYEQRQLTRHHHNLKEELNVYTNRLQKCIDLVFPEFNSLFKSKYGTVYMSILKTFGSAKQLKDATRTSIGILSIAEEIQIKHLIGQIELIHAQLDEIEKNRRVFLQDQLFYHIYTRNFSFLWYIYFSRNRRYWQLPKSIEISETCWCCSL